VLSFVTSEITNSTFWWLLHDSLKYKRPLTEGKVLLPHDYLVPGFVPDMTELWYSFVHGWADQRLIADFSGWLGAAFFVNDKAYRAFEDLFVKHGRAYRVRCSNEPHYIVLIDTLHDAIDLPRCRFERLDLNERVEDDISRFFKIALREGFKTDDDIFRLDGSYKLGSEMIVSNRFKQRYEQSGLTGLVFKSASD
jgi:hypothetical protein